MAIITDIHPCIEFVRRMAQEAVRLDALTRFFGLNGVTDTATVFPSDEMSRVTNLVAILAVCVSW
jgi:hypothetical protein